MTKLIQSIPTKKFSLVVILAGITILTLITFSACSSSSALVGRWEAVSVELEDGEDVYSEDVFDYFIEFFSDGTGIVVFLEMEDGFVWSVENGRLMAGSSDTGFFTLYADYTISGSTLTLTTEESWGTQRLILRRVQQRILL